MPHRNAKLGRWDIFASGDGFLGEHFGGSCAPPAKERRRQPRNIAALIEPPIGVTPRVGTWQSSDMAALAIFFIVFAAVMFVKLGDVADWLDRR